MGFRLTDKTPLKCTLGELTAEEIEQDIRAIPSLYDDHIRGCENDDDAEEDNNDSSNDARCADNDF